MKTSVVFNSDTMITEGLGVAKCLYPGLKKNNELSSCKQKMLKGKQNKFPLNGAENANKILLE